MARTECGRGKSSGGRQQERQRQRKAAPGGDEGSKERQRAKAAEEKAKKIGVVLFYLLKDFSTHLAHEGKYKDTNCDLINLDIVAMWADPTPSRNVDVKISVEGEGGTSLPEKARLCRNHAEKLHITHPTVEPMRGNALERRGVGHPDQPQHL